MNALPQTLTGCEVLPPMGPPAPKPPGATPQRPAKPAPTKQKPDKRGAAGRFAVLNGFVDVSLAGLCGGDVAVWLVLFRDTRDGTARTGQADIARRSGLSTRGVRKALKRLESRGLLRCVYRGGLNRGPSRYAVLPGPVGGLAEEPISSSAQRNPGRKN